MATPGASVLIVDGSAAIRGVIAAILEHAGFRTSAADDLRKLSPLSKFAVIVRDLNLAPAECERSLRQFAATAPELLQRTVVLTTAPARAEALIDVTSVFAVIGKPFDVDRLVDAVRACALRWRETDGAAWPRRARHDEGEAPVKLEAVRRFVTSAAGLQRVLAVPAATHREAVLRAQMLRTIRVLSATLDEAAHVEADSTRAAVLRAASLAAARLAVGSPARAGERAPSRRNH